MSFLPGPDLSALLEDAKAGLDKNSRYSGFYPIMCRAAEVLGNDSGNPDPLTALAHLAYGWMPTIMKNVAGNSDMQRDLVKRVSNATSLNAAETIFASLQTPPVNNSWVGTSKVFHFLAPGAFPIWDSKVARHFDIHSAGAVNNRKNYAGYLSYVKANHTDTAVDAFREAHENIWKYDVSRIRGVELLLFLSAPPARKAKGKQ